MITRTQTTTRRSVLQGFVLAKHFTDFKQFAPIKLLFIVIPLSNEVVLYRLRFASVGSPENCGMFFFVFWKNGFTSPAVGNDQSQTVNGEALVFSRETGRNCNMSRENSQ